jgi:hypothetical protein
VSKTRTVEDFRRAHDPAFEQHVANIVYEGVSVPKGTRRFIITSAQNATPVVKDFWASLLHCRDYYKAHLSVIPYRYKNPTSRWTGSQNNAEFWVEEVREYLKSTRWAVNSNLVVLGDIKIVPTARDPLKGHEGFTGAESSIIGHPNLALTSVATPGHAMAKLMTTTGSCTQLNYSDSRAGRGGEYQHVTGALLVEVEGGKFWIRQLNANKKGQFIDKDKLFTPDGVVDAPPPEALVCGDAHVRKMDFTVDKGVFGPKGIVRTLKPKRIVFHDLFDGSTCNPHEKKDYFAVLAKMKAGLLNVADELNETVQYVIDRVPKGCQAIIVDSNHDAFLKRWLEDNDWKEVGLNGGTYLELAKYMWDETTMHDGDERVPSPFAYWVNKFARKNIICLREDESYAVEGVELGMHGHRGPNGVRGSLVALVRIGVKFIIGHVHGPGIRFGGYAVGLMAKLRQGYNKGPSNWLHTMCIEHAAPCGGKRQLVTIIDGRPWL